MGGLAERAKGKRGGAAAGRGAGSRRRTGRAQPGERSVNTAGGAGDRRTFAVRIDSDPANLAPARKAVETFVAESGFAEKAVHDVGLCLNEALANVMRHAYDGRKDR